MATLSKMSPYFEADFDAKNKTRFRSKGHSYLGDFQDYAPHIFRDLRMHFGVSESLYVEELVQGLVELSEGAGRSGSDVFFSANDLFVVKTITYSEGKLLRNILSQYYMHMKSNPHSLLVRIYGLYRVSALKGGKDQR